MQKEEVLNMGGPVEDLMNYAEENWLVKMDGMDGVRAFELCLKNTMSKILNDLKQWKGYISQESYTTMLEFSLEFITRRVVG